MYFCKNESVLVTSTSCCQLSLAAYFVNAVRQSSLSLGNVSNEAVITLIGVYVGSYVMLAVMGLPASGKIVNRNTPQ